MTAALTDIVPQAAKWIFSPAFLWQVVDGRHRTLLRQLGVTRALGPATTVAKMYERVYAEMLRSYRVEYVYKNEIIRKLFLARHDAEASAVVLEQQVDHHNTRLDLVVVNSTTTAYEVKTEHDSLARLERQTVEALRVFDRVVVACADAHLDRVRQLVDERVGLVRFGVRGGLSMVRPAASNGANVEPVAVFQVLRKNERQRAVGDRFGLPPLLAPFERYEWERDCFTSLPPNEAHSVLLAAFRARHLRPGVNLKAQESDRPMLHLYYKLTPAERTRLLRPEILERSIG